MINRNSRGITANSARGNGTLVSLRMAGGERADGWPYREAAAVILARANANGGPANRRVDLSCRHLRASGSAVRSRRRSA
jgi:hypothetical protein